MKIFRYRKPSINSSIGITGAKRKIAKATGIPTTKAGRKRKAMNAMTGGAYGKYTKGRAKVNRPGNRAKRPASCLGCLVYVIGISGMIAVFVYLLCAAII